MQPPRGLAAGDVVRVFNDRGQCLAGVRIDEGLKRGVVVMSTGAWYDPLVPAEIGTLDKHGNPNVLTRDKGTSKLTQGASAHTCLVEVERFAGALPPITAYDRRSSLQRTRDRPVLQTRFAGKLHRRRFCMFSLKDKVAVITGSTKGIGKSIAEEMAKAGAKVVISSRKADACEAVLKEFQARGQEAIAIACNVGQKDQLQSLVDGTLAKWGKIDIVVCNAASNPVFGPLIKVPDDASTRSC